LTALLFFSGLIYGAHKLLLYALSPHLIFAAHSWNRWDSAHYLQIAADGYELVSCASIAGYSPEQWCGNAGWLPAYPLLIRLTAVAGFSYEQAGLILSWLMAFLVLFLVGALLRRYASRTQILLIMGLAAFFPGSFYQYALFPVSTFLVAALLALYLLERDYGRGAAVAAAGGAFAYATGFLMAPVIAAGFFIKKWNASPRPAALKLALKSAWLGLIVLLGLTAVLVYHELAVGDWRAFFLVQAKYGHAVQNPLYALAQAVLAASSRYQSVSLLLFLAAVGAASIWKLYQTRRLVVVDAVIAIYCAVYWLFPLALGGGVSIYRAEALLLPAVLLARHLPWPITLAFAALFAMVYFHMLHLFFNGVLV
jgi:hypothetical protein